MNRKKWNDPSLTDYEKVRRLVGPLLNSVVFTQAGPERKMLFGRTQGYLPPMLAPLVGEGPATVLGILVTEQMMADGRSDKPTGGWVPAPLTSTKECEWWYGQPKIPDSTFNKHIRTLEKNKLIERCRKGAKGRRFVKVNYRRIVEGIELLMTATNNGRW
jgi:hypothetical protein